LELLEFDEIGALTKYTDRKTREAITEAEAGTGYVFGEGIREPLRVRAGWVPDTTIKELETFVTGPIEQDTTVLPFPPKPTDPTGSTHGGAA
jgi:S-DNA-T family DNA segregation ATPase FtsK/SpoIIIE